MFRCRAACHAPRRLAAVFRALRTALASFIFLHNIDTVFCPLAASPDFSLVFIAMVRLAPPPFSAFSIRRLHSIHTCICISIYLYTFFFVVNLSSTNFGDKVICLKFFSRSVSLREETWCYNSASLTTATRSTPRQTLATHDKPDAHPFYVARLAPPFVVIVFFGAERDDVRRATLGGLRSPRLCLLPGLLPTDARSVTEFSQRPIPPFLLGPRRLAASAARRWLLPACREPRVRHARSSAIHSSICFPD